MLNSKENTIRFSTSYLICILLTLLSGTTVFAQGSIFGAVSNSDLTSPANGEISFFGFLDNTDEEIRIETSIGAGYDNGHWFDDFQNYLTESPGNPYEYVFYNLTNSEGFVLSDVIPNNSFQNEDILLAPVSWPSQPTGLTGQSISATSLEISWTALNGLTYHIYRREATSGGSFFRIDDPLGSLDSRGVAGGSYIDNTVDENSSYHFLIIAEDDLGNYSPHSEYITLTAQQPEAPVITCPADVIVECYASIDPANTGVATATDNIDPNPEITYEDIVSDGSCPQEQIISRTWTATDSDGNFNQCIQTITVADNTPPTITCPADMAINFGSSSAPSNTGMATATDLCDNDPLITYGDESNGNIITRTWTATDACGNSSNCDQTIEIIMHSGPIWHVSVDGDDSNDGSFGYPFATIQRAVDQCIPGDTVLIYGGVYSGTGNRDIDPNGKNIVIHSNSGPELTIIDCEGIKDEPHRGFYIGNGENNGFALIGLTIQNGYSVSEGGAILCEDSSPLIHNCIIRNNKSSHGGAGLTCLSASPDIFDCQFIANDADQFGGAIYSAGETSLPEISLSDFKNNHAGESGGAILLNNSTPTISNCSFENNIAEIKGGAVCLQYSSAEITGCSFDANISNSTGGAVYCEQSSPAILQSIFAQNNALDNGGVMACEYSSSPTLTNCTMVQNGSPKGAGAYCNISSPILTNCLIAFGVEGQAIYCRDNKSDPTITCSDIFGNIGGDWVGRIENQGGLNGNFSADPLFCEMASGNYQLAGNSLCLPENNDCGILVGMYEKGCDISTDITNDNNEIIPEYFQLYQNFPNPFNPATTIQFDLPTKSRVTITIYNVLGREVRLLLNTTVNAGRHEVIWNGRSDNGREVSSGIYFYKIQAEDNFDRKKMLLLK